MRRDFSESAKQELLALVDQVEDEKWCNLTDWFGDRWYDFETWTGSLNINNYLDNLSAYHKKVIDKNNTTRKDIEEIFKNVHSVDDKYAASTRNLINDFNGWISYVAKLGEILDPAKGSVPLADILFSLRMIYRGISSLGKSKLNWDDIRRKVYNSTKKGYFGGKQGSPKKLSRAEKDELYEIFKKNNPDVDLSAKEFDKYLQKLNSEGCGYVALVNTIFCYYAGRPDEFRRVFGYDMYAKNGNLNYNMLLMDLYSRMDNRDPDGDLDLNYDYNEKVDGPKSTYNPWTDTSGRGTNQGNRKYYIEQFMKEHGVDVEVTNSVNVTPDNCEEILESGKQIIVSFHDGNLRNMDGSVAQYIDGGHAMTIVGVTPEGCYIVSSWGGQYYIDPNEECGSCSFQTVEF